MTDLREIYINELKGVGPKKVQLFNKIGIFTIFDLLNYFPRTYEDFSQTRNIKELEGEKGLISVRVLTSPITKRIRNNLNLLTFTVSDGFTTGEVAIFNNPYLKKYIKVNDKKYIYCSIKKNQFTYQIQNPIFLTQKDIGKLSPVYNLTAGLSNKEVIKVISLALQNYGDNIVDFLPNNIVKEFNMETLKNSIYNIHFPNNINLLEKARKRLAFNEMFILQSNLDINSFRNSKVSGSIIDTIKYKNQISNFINSLTFTLTNAQKKVLDEIFVDLNQGSMNRLLQGDVGSGKTVVAAITLYTAYLNGYQSALMAPTEILAKQHYETIKSYFSNYNINIQLLTGDVKKKDKEEIYTNSANGSINIIVGTHALIQKDVVFKNLGLTIIDEQHRFGVNQRKELYDKGDHPQNLAMTATPIPRTLALVIYGDMEVSIMNQLPPGRKPIDTIVVDESYIDRLDKFVIEQIKEGRQVFVVCPLIEENDMPLKSLEEVYNHYSSTKFKKENIVTTYLHGKMKNEEKNRVMIEFSENKSQILVSTTVIEVGINVPNANLMIIYNADRFGLSQLHQLRGRVGRGAEKPYCVLINNNKSEISYKRMKVMKQSSDGFYISEQDLELRGQGELTGTRQHGVADLRLINFKNDIKIIEFVKSNYNYLMDNIKVEKNNYDELEKYLTYNVQDVENSDF